MAKVRDKEDDKTVTRQMILDPKRAAYSGGVNWLGHGARGGKNAKIDYSLLNGATMRQLLRSRNTGPSIRAHFRHLKMSHGLPVTRGPDGKYRFNRKYLEIPEAAASSKSHDLPISPPLPEEIVQPLGLIEGSICTISVNAYERNGKARKLCIAHYGPACVICGFDFGVTYGSFAKDFVHVHHLKPLSEIGSEYQVDPVTDLRPVCPNCHAVIHLGGGCRSIHAVRKLLGLNPARHGTARKPTV